MASDYSVGSDGSVGTDVPSDVTFYGGNDRGNSHNCDVSWAGAPDPYLLPATATAESDTPAGDYRTAIPYEVNNAPHSGPAGKLSNAGTVNVTIHVVPPTPVIVEPVVDTPPKEQVVLGERIAARPRFAHTVRLSHVKGKVRYRSPGGSVTTLGDAVIVPNGTVVDATKGTVKVTVERSPGGTLDSLNAWAGGFVVIQGQNGVTTLTLAAPLASKASRATRTARASRKRHGKHKWLLWADGKGNFKTKGNKASAVLRGTAWVTTDTGTSTKVSVKRGAVLVRDFVTHRGVIVTAGHSYTAREKRASARRVPAFTGRA